MKEILMSIQPQWVDLIMSKKKVLEIRKTFPSRQTEPFKVYIYCTKAEPILKRKREFGKEYILNGRVVGEFTCAGCVTFDVPYPAYQSEMNGEIIEKSCVSYMELHNYLGRRQGKGWVIEDVVEYDEPKMIEEVCGWSAAPMSWGFIREK